MNTVAVPRNDPRSARFQLASLITPAHKVGERASEKDQGRRFALEYLYKPSRPLGRAKPRTPERQQPYIYIYIYIFTRPKIEMPEYVDPKSQDLEVDSDYYASTLGTDTTSLGPAADNHVFENGRRFHGRLAV